MNQLVTFDARCIASRWDYRPHLGVIVDGCEDGFVIVGYSVSIDAEQRNARIYNRVETPKLSGFRVLEKSFSS